MSALAARRAAKLSQADHFSSSSAPTTAVEPARNTAVHVRPATPTDSEGEANEPFVSEAGPSKRVRYTQPQARPRYYAPAAPQSAPAAGSPVGAATPARKPKRKRAYSPGAPAESDGAGDSSAEERDDSHSTASDIQGADISYAATPYGTPGPSKLRSVGEGVRGATSSFVTRRGVNVEVISSSTLQGAGLVNPGGLGLVISLGAGENLSLAGVFTLMPLRRCISLFSTLLEPSPNTQIRHPVFAPISHPIPSISSAPSGANSPADSPILSRLSLSATFDLSPGRALFLLLEHPTGIGGMRAGAIPGFNTAWGEEKGWMGLRGVHAIPGSLLSTCYPHTSPAGWENALSSLVPRKQVNGHGMNDSIESDTPIVLVKGPKRSGKSAVAKAALNALLSEYEQVAWLECDLGQGEFGCGGVIGLWMLTQPVLGPPFTHPRLPERAHFLGTYTPLTCPDEYVAAVDHLLQHYRYEKQYPAVSSSKSPLRRRTDVVPLVINTQGWVKGLGEELLRAIEGLAQATHVFAFESAVDDTSDRPGWTSSPTLPTVPLPATSTGRPPIVHMLEPAPVSPLQARYTAADHRTLSTLAYFYATLPDPERAAAAAVQWDFATPLIAAPPYEVTLGEAVKAVYIIGEGSDGVEPSDLHLALNGSIVALLSVEDMDESLSVFEQNRPLPPLDQVNFIGFGIIRAVSPGAGSGGMRLHLLTPLPPAVLARVNALAKNGAMELPTPGMLDWRNRAGFSGAAGEGIAGVPWGEVPFFDVGPRGVGSERRKWRKNIMRKGV